MSEFQEAVRVDMSSYGGKYIYTCHKCGAEVHGYHNKRVRGHVLCSKCAKNRAAERYQTNKARLDRIREIVEQGEPTNIGREITLQKIKELLV